MRRRALCRYGGRIAGKSGAVCRRGFSVGSHYGRWNAAKMNRIIVPVGLGAVGSGIMLYGLRQNKIFLERSEKRGRMMEERNNFNKFISITDEREMGNNDMNFDDLLSCLFNTPVNVDSEGSVLAAFVGNDERIHFSDFVLVKKLLMTSDAALTQLFTSICKDNEGMSKKQFLQFLSELLPDYDGSLNFDSLNGLDYLFQSNPKLTLEVFSNTVHDIKREYCYLEYQMITKDKSHFRNYLKSSQLPHWIKTTLLQSQEKLDFTTYLAIQKVSHHFDQIQDILSTPSDQPLNQKSFTSKLISILPSSTSSLINPEDYNAIFNLLGNSNKTHSDSNGDSDSDINNHIYLAGMDVSSSSSSSKNGKSPKKNSRDRGFVGTLVLSGASAMVGATSVFPIDKVKTRLQSSTKPQKNMIKGLTRMLSSIFRKEGFFGLYRGLEAQLIGITPEKAVKLTVNDYLRRYQKDPNNPNAKLKFHQELLAGVGTGCIQIFITNPYETVKIRMQNQKPGDVKKGIIRICSELGPRGLYRGMAATFARDVPFNAIYFSLYSVFRNALAGDDEPSIVQHLIGACCAGVFAAAVDTPADTVKTRLQSGKYPYRGFRDAIQTMYAKEGISAFTKGMLPRILIISPLFAITFATFEALKTLFEGM